MEIRDIASVIRSRSEFRLLAQVNLTDPSQRGALGLARGLLARRPTNVVLVAMANKTARVVWAMLSRDQTYMPDRQAAA